MTEKIDCLTTKPSSLLIFVYCIFLRLFTLTKLCLNPVFKQKNIIFYCVFCNTKVCNATNLKPKVATLNIALNHVVISHRLLNAFV